MKPTSTDRELRDRIDAFVVEISNLVRISALEAVHAALGSTLGAPAAPAAKRGPGRPPKSASAPAASAPKASGGKRSPEAVLKTADAVLAYIKAHPGQRLEEIGKGVKMPTKDLKLPIQKLFDAKSISTKGVKRGTKYFVR
jgi:hypothetical protein